MKVFQAKYQILSFISFVGQMICALSFNYLARQAHIRYNYEKYQAHEPLFIEFFYVFWAIGLFSVIWKSWIKGRAKQIKRGKLILWMIFRPIFSIVFWLPVIYIFVIYPILCTQWGQYF